MFGYCLVGRFAFRGCLMGKFKHTPGTWTVEVSKNDYNQYDLNNNQAKAAIEKATVDL
jgi:hypothetical protein